MSEILRLSESLERTPLKRECSAKLVHAASKFFGSWNKAMKECGLTPNASKFNNVRLTCHDGHIAESISEKLVDEWFYKHHITHERCKKYPNSQMDCDFYLPDYDLWVEYFGLIGHLDEYDIGVEAKRRIVVDSDLNFIEIVSADLYPDNKLDEIFHSLPKTP